MEISPRSVEINRHSGRTILMALLFIAVYAGGMGILTVEYGGIAYFPYVVALGVIAVPITIATILFISRDALFDRENQLISIQSQKPRPTRELLYAEISDKGRVERFTLGFSNRRKDLVTISKFDDDNTKLRMMELLHVSGISQTKDSDGTSPFDRAESFLKRMM